MTHTPGPWKILKGWAVNGHTAIEGRDREDVARVPWPGNEREQANARLIAAAPELLAACKEILENWWKEDMDHYSFPRHIGDLLRAVIAKAEPQPCRGLEDQC